MTVGLVLLVSGTRDDDLARQHEDMICARLAEHTRTGYRYTYLIHGACGTEAGGFWERVIKGVDGVADRWARFGPCILPMPADWAQHRRSAGPIRNANMVRLAKALAESGWTVKILAFPGPDSRGTWNLVRLAREAGFTPFVEELV